MRRASCGVDGGAAVNDTLMQMAGRPAGHPRCCAPHHETTALGAAWLAGLGVGLGPTCSSSEPLWQLERRFDPSAALLGAGDAGPGGTMPWRRCAPEGGMAKAATGVPLVPATHLTSVTRHPGCPHCLPDYPPPRAHASATPVPGAGPGLRLGHQLPADEGGAARDRAAHLCHASFCVHRTALRLLPAPAQGELAGPGRSAACCWAWASSVSCGWAIHRDITPGLASLTLQTQVFFTIGLAMLVRGDRVKPLQWLALVVALVGMGIIAEAAWSASQDSASRSRA